MNDIGTRGRAFLRRQRNAAIWEMPDIDDMFRNGDWAEGCRLRWAYSKRRDELRPKRAAWYAKRVKQASRWYHRVWAECR